MADDDRQKWLHELGARLKVARKRAGLTLQEVGDRLGVSKQLASHREIQRSEITTYDLARFVQLTDSDGHWLLTGHAPPTQQIPQRPGYVAPMASLREVMMIAVALEEEPGGQWRFSPADMHHQLVPIRTRISILGMAIAMPDRSLEPEIAAGDVVVADADLRPEPGDVGLFCLIMTGEVFVRRLETPMSKGSFTLSATNPLFETKKVTPAHRPWAFKVVEVSRTYQPDVKFHKGDCL